MAQRLPGFSQLSVTMNDSNPSIGLNTTQTTGLICSEQTTFIHQSLDLSRQQIRLLKVENGERGSPVYIECEIQHFDPESCPSYQAISYTWGDPDSAFAISLNRLEFS
jgi:hypothetical protein